LGNYLSDFANKHLPIISFSSYACVEDRLISFLVQRPSRCFCHPQPPTWTRALVTMANSASSQGAKPPVTANCYRARWYSNCLIQFDCPSIKPHPSMYWWGCRLSLALLRSLLHRQILVQFVYQVFLFHSMKGEPQILECFYCRINRSTQSS